MLTSKINLTESGGVTYTSLYAAVHAIAQNIADNLLGMGWSDNSNDQGYRIEKTVYNHTKIRVFMTKSDGNRLDVNFFASNKNVTEYRSIFIVSITPTESTNSSGTKVYSWNGLTLASYETFGDNFVIVQDNAYYTSACVVNSNCGSVIFNSSALYHWSNAANAWIKESMTAFTNLTDVSDNVVYAYRTSISKIDDVNGFSVIVSPGLLLPSIALPSSTGSDFSIDLCEGKSRLVWYPTIIH